MMGCVAVMAKIKSLLRWGIPSVALVSAALYYAHVHRERGAGEPGSDCSKMPGTVAIQPSLQEEAPRAYRLMLAFNAPMKTENSFLLAHNVTGAAWEDPSTFVISFGSKVTQDGVSIVLNPEGREHPFTTACGVTLPSQTIQTALAQD